MNGQSKIVEREIRFKSGVAFGIDKMLIPLGNGGRCDEIRDTKTLVRQLPLSVICSLTNKS